jgi:glyoxylase-like metal-dependent hydrolase (beta-lactamase superfamily II)
VEPGEICALLATHAHSDHSALAATLAEIHGWPLWRGPGPVTAVDALRDNAEPVAARRRRCRRAGVPESDLELMADALITGQLGTETRRPADRELGDGDRFRGRRSAWEVIMMPGHSPSQVGLWDAERRRLIGADIAYGAGIPFLEWGHSPDPLAEHVASLRRVAALDPALLLPGHGRPDPSPQTRLRAAGAALDDVRTRLLNAVAARPSTAYELACDLAPDNADPDVRQSHLATTLAVLDALVHERAVVVRRSPRHDAPTIFATPDAHRLGCPPGRQRRKMTSIGQVATPAEMLWELEQLKQLKARYFRGVDTEDWELFGSCFTHDVRTKLPGTGWREGLDEILGAVVKHHTDAEVVTAHHGHMPEIELTGEDSAR